MSQISSRMAEDIVNTTSGPSLKLAKYDWLTAIRKGIYSTYNHSPHYTNLNNHQLSRWCFIL